MKEKRLIVLENAKLRMLVLKREEVRTDRRKLQEEEISN